VRKAASQLFVVWVDFGGTTESRKSLRPKPGTVIPGWFGSSIPCVGGLRRKPNRIPPTSLSRDLKTRCESAFSSVPRMWTTFMSRRVREMLSTCMGSFSGAVATLAAALPSTTRIATNRQSKVPGVNAAVGFVHISAGSAKCRSSWIESIERWINALSSSRSGLQAWSSPLPALLPWSTVVRAQSTWDRKVLQTHPRLRSVIWIKRARFCLTSSASCDGSKDAIAAWHIPDAACERKVSNKWRLSRCERATPYLQRTTESCPAKAANPLSIACRTRSGNPGTSSRKTAADTEAEIAVKNQNRPVSIKFASFHEQPSRLANGWWPRCHY
jgi:hypothetical protein